MKQSIFTFKNEPLERYGHPSKMVRRHGQGPKDKKCIHCVHHVVFAYSKNYHKCKELGITSGPGTDIRVNWDACAKFKQKGDL